MRFMRILDNLMTTKISAKDNIPKDLEYLKSFSNNEIPFSELKRERLSQIDITTKARTEIWEFSDVTYIEEKFE